MKMERDGDKLTIFAQGRIDAISTPQFAGEVEKSLDGVMELIFDFSQLEYISSSGLRIIMQVIKAMGKRRGELRIVNVSEDVYEVLETTGFTGACDIEMKR